MSRSRRKRHYRARAALRRLMKRPHVRALLQIMRNDHSVLEQRLQKMLDAVSIKRATGAELDRIAEMIGVPNNGSRR